MTFNVYRILPEALEDAIYADDPESIKTHFPTPRTVENEYVQDTALREAMDQSSLETIKLLLQLGAKLNNMAMYSAIERGNPAAFQVLIDCGWDINSTALGRTAVHHTLQHEALLRWVLEHGANPNIVSGRVRGSCMAITTPMAEAAKFADSTPLQILLSYGAKIDPEAIFYAIRGTRGAGFGPNGTATMRVLIEHGADVNYVSKKWATPLCQAVKFNNEEKVRLLLNHGADPNVKSLKRGFTALGYAKELGHLNLYEMMETAQSLGLP